MACVDIGQLPVYVAIYFVRHFHEAIFEVLHRELLERHIHVRKKSILKSKLSLGNSRVKLG